MKHIFTLAAAVVVSALCVLTSCEDKSKQKLDPNAKVYINAAKIPQAAPSKASGKTLTPLEIVKTARSIHTSKGSLGVGDWNRDTVNVRFIVGSNWVVTEFGELELFFIESSDIVFVTLDENLNPKDTLAYIPNEVMAKAEKDIKAAYEAENYAECYRLLQEAFVFVPSTDVQ